jgi:hypothetical protein
MPPEHSSSKQRWENLVRQEKGDDRVLLNSMGVYSEGWFPTLIIKIYRNM